MNAAARALAQGSLTHVSGYSFTLSRELLGVVFLIVAVLASALAVVYIKDLDRQLFSELQSLNQTREELKVEWGQLVLEQNTWAATARVQTIAQQQMGMVLPAAKDITLVSIPQAGAV
jgi:cell division protein FtsL